VTGVEVITENFFLKVSKMLLEVEDRGQHYTNWGEKFSMMINNASCYLFRHTSAQNLCYFTLPSNKVNKQHGYLLTMYYIRFSHDICHTTLWTYSLAIIGLYEFDVNMVIVVLNINEAGCRWHSYTSIVHSPVVLLRWWLWGICEHHMT